MLFKQIHLKGIQAGTIKFAFRKWEKLAVKKGSLQKTSIGLIEIVSIQPIQENQIKEKDSIEAGFENREQLLKSLRQTEDGIIYKIGVRFYSEDPRISLRNQVKLSDQDFSELKMKLERLDKFSKEGPWTSEVLKAINKYPRKRAADLAVLAGYEKVWLKLNIRKLKNLGLTISHEVGYELSPLGKKYASKIKVK